MGATAGVRLQWLLRYCSARDSLEDTGRGRCAACCCCHQFMWLGETLGLLSFVPEGRLVSEATTACRGKLTVMSTLPKCISYVPGLTFGGSSSV